MGFISRKIFIKLFKLLRKYYQGCFIIVGLCFNCFVEGAFDVACSFQKMYAFCLARVDSPKIFKFGSVSTCNALFVA